MIRQFHFLFNQLEIERVGSVLRAEIKDKNLYTAWDEGKEMGLDDAVIMMGTASAERQVQSPQDLGGVNQSLFIYVDDVDTHYQHAKASGATILMEPDEMFWGDRIYAVADLEDHQWTFAQHVKDIPPEEMQLPADW